MRPGGRRRVVPVLVGGAAMPRVSELPEPLKDLAYRNASVLDDRRFASDVRALQGALRQFADDLVSERSAGRSVATPEPGGPRPLAEPRQADRGPGPVACGQRAEPSRPGPDVWSALPTVLTVSGAALVFIWGVLEPRDGHSEQSGLRVGAAVELVVGAAVGLWSRQWRWVLAAGAAGLVGLVLWMLQLLATGAYGGWSPGSRSRSGCGRVARRVWAPPKRSLLSLWPTASPRSRDSPSRTTRSRPGADGPCA
jgi:hypothetical protein